MQPSCPLCQGQGSEINFSDKGYDVRICKNCELMFIDPYPSNMDDVHEHVTTNEYEELDVIEPNKKYLGEVQFYKRYFHLIEQECKDAKSILDVGCGTGYLLERLAMYPDLLRAGIELNIARAEFARKKANCEIYQIPVEDFSSESKFDVITMINVLSHIPDFDTLFKALRSLLNEDGKLLLKVGEMRRDVRKKDVFDWGIPGHLHFLGLNTIDFICKKYGFSVVKHRRIPRSQDFFSRERWQTPGRSGLRNLVKKIIVSTPMALPIVSKVYGLIYGDRIYSSFIVLKCDNLQA